MALTGVAAAATDLIFYNRTSDNHIVVMVFARPYPVPITEETFKMAWKVMLVPSMGNVKFSYPVENRISAFYYNGSNRVSAGPCAAAPGTTWIAQTTESGGVSLEQDVEQLPVPDGGYVVHNKQPDTSNNIGRVLNIALYKGQNTRRPLVSKQCRVGNYVTLKTTDVLYFGAMIPAYSMAYEYMSKGNRQISFEPVEFSEHDDLTLVPDAEFSKLTKVDLPDPAAHNGLEVMLDEEPSNGKLYFTTQRIPL